MSVTGGENLLEGGPLRVTAVRRYGSMGTKVRGNVW